MTITEAKQRMQSLRWGVFNHFLYSAPSSDIHYVPAMTDWNRRVEMFDAERVAYDLHTIGAGYYFITLMQGRKYMCAPNATFDRIAGTKPGEACSHRDLIWDISEALAKYDIDLYLYYTGDGPYQDVEIGERFGFLEPRKNVSMTFVKNWASVLEEYSVRYGERVKGYWIDGCYDFFDYNQELLAPYYEAVKKGNPSALVTMNNGVKDDLYRWYHDEDFTSGEFNDFTVIPGTTDVFPSVPHILAPLGVSLNGNPWECWRKPGCKRDGAYMRNYVREVNARGGVVSIDIQIRDDSTFDEEQLRCLAEINK